MHQAKSLTAIATATVLGAMLAGCLTQHTVYTFDEHGQVSVDSTMELGSELLGQTPEEETIEFVNEALFSELGDRHISQQADGSWSSSGPAVPIEQFARFLEREAVDVERTADAYRFTSAPLDSKAHIEAVMRAECASDEDMMGLGTLCERVGRMLADPAIPIDGLDAPAELPSGVTMTGDEIAAAVVLLRAQMARVTLRIDLKGAVRDTEGFTPLPGGGWTYEGGLYELIEQPLAWTVPVTPAPAGQARTAAEPARHEAEAPPRDDRSSGARASPPAPLPTPEVHVIEDVSGENGTEVAFVLRAPLGDGSQMVGIALTCTKDTGILHAAAHFGSFPADGRPVQLAVRTAAGRIERFGPVVRGGPASGFHSPTIDEPSEALRFANAALSEGALVSNGFQSAWNRASEQSNAAARRRLEECMDGGSEADAPTAALSAVAVGVPPAHWSEEFSFGIEFSAPVTAIPESAFISGSQIVLIAPDNSRQTRWHVRVKPGWSADANITLSASSECIPGESVCATNGAALSTPVVVRVPARPEK